MRRGATFATVAAGLAVVATGCGGNQRDGGASTGPPEGTKTDATRNQAANSASSVTLRHPPTGFSIRASNGFALAFRQGVYDLSPRRGAVGVT